MINAMEFVKNPYKMCEKIYNLMQALTGHLKDLIAQKVYDTRGRMVLILKRSRLEVVKKNVKLLY